MSCNGDMFRKDDAYCPRCYGGPILVIKRDGPFEADRYMYAKCENCGHEAVAARDPRNYLFVVKD